MRRQYRACRRNKRNTHNALAFEIDAEANLLQLQDELRTRRYRPGRSICFVTASPKPREVFAADFRDRIVHHLLVSHQEPVFEPRFIHDSYACRVGKGTLAASDRLMAFLGAVTANGHRPAWALHLDVASFFPSIDKAAALCSTLASYAGHLRHGQSMTAWRRVWAREPWLGALWERDGWTFRPRWSVAGSASPLLGGLGVEYRAPCARLGTAVLAFHPVGRFVEFYGPQRVLASAVLGLRAARLHRAGYAFTVGFPVQRWVAYAERALAAGVAILVVGRLRAVRLVVSPGRRGTRWESKAQGRERH